AAGSYDDIVKKADSITGQYLSGVKEIAIPKKRRKPSERKITIVGAKHNNLKDLTVDFPLGTFICVTGVSGSGKSSLINDILMEGIRSQESGVRNQESDDSDASDEDDLLTPDPRLLTPARFERLDGLKHIDKIIDIDQSP